MWDELGFKQVVMTANPRSNLEANCEAGGCCRPVTGSWCCGSPGSLDSVLPDRCSVCPTEMQGSGLAPFSLHTNGKAVDCLNGDELDPGNYCYSSC